MNRDDQFTYFGADFLWNRPTAITDTDRRQHMYLIGRTGTGKSTLIENLILQDIYRGLGVAFVDPHGTSAERLLDRIPSFRTRDVGTFARPTWNVPWASTFLRRSIWTRLTSLLKAWWEPSRASGAIPGGHAWIASSTTL